MPTETGNMGRFEPYRRDVDWTKAEQLRSGRARKSSP